MYAAHCANNQNSRIGDAAVWLLIEARTPPSIPDGLSRRGSAVTSQTRGWERAIGNAVPAKFFLCWTMLPDKKVNHGSRKAPEATGVRVNKYSARDLLTAGAGVRVKIAESLGTRFYFSSIHMVSA